ncbi:MAG TPA: hypothetical protein VNG51_04185 [Ktedonobacteraceae bacterium]|nr:hypothetical protein [Ktedonobacteraceae bacterium]
MEPQYRVIIHFDEADEKKQVSVLRNVRNVLEDLGADQTQVELVAHGPGLDIFLDQSTVADGVAELLARGVIMAACRNTLRERNIAPERLLLMQTAPAQEVYARYGFAPPSPFISKIGSP